MSIMQIIVVIVVGIVGGFINTLAGDGSLLTLPALIFVGLPSAVVNGTDRVAVMMNNTMAIVGFKQRGLADYKFSLGLAVPAVVVAMAANLLGLIPI